jgi:hypothetical protein
VALFFPIFANDSTFVNNRQDQKLKTALQDYENEKWRIIANKVGTGFTPAACRERAASLLGENLPNL